MSEFVDGHRRDLRDPTYGEVVRPGEPVAPNGRIFGVDRGRFVVPDLFDKGLPIDVLDSFEEEER